MENLIKLCPSCGMEQRLVPAGVSRKTNKPYQAFWACPNKCKMSTKQDEGNKIIMDELAKINQRLDGLAKFLSEKLK